MGEGKKRCFDLYPIYVLQQYYIAFGFASMSKLLELTKYLSECMFICLYILMYMPHSAWSVAAAPNALTFVLKFDMVVIAKISMNARRCCCCACDRYLLRNIKTIS